MAATAVALQRADASMLSAERSPTHKSDAGASVDETTMKDEADEEATRDTLALTQHSGVCESMSRSLLIMCKH